MSRRSRVRAAGVAPARAGVAGALAAAMLALARSGLAAAPLPPPPAVDAAIHASPMVRAARAGADESVATANALAAGPHEWVVQATGQSRDVLHDQRYPEWYASVERGVRWPEKRRLDRELGQMERELGRARVEESERDARADLLEAWFTCLLADHRAAAADAEARSADALAGEAAQALQLLGLSAECRGVAVEGLPPERARPLDPLPTPAVRRAQIEAQRAATEAQRASADQRPDPLLGLRMGSEFGGQDRLAALTITFPLPGARRAAEASKAYAHARAVDAAVAAADRRERALRLQYETLEIEARTRSALAAADAAARGRVAEALLRGYALGDGDLSTAVLTRRDARRAALTATLARIDAWRGATLADLYAPPNEELP